MFNSEKSRTFTEPCELLDKYSEKEIFSGKQKFSEKLERFLEKLKN